VKKKDLLDWPQDLSQRNIGFLIKGAAYGFIF
jgi:hypothetical protein